MKMNLNFGAIGVKVSQREGIELAHRYGFEALDAQPDFLASLTDADLQKLLDDMKARGLVFGTSPMRLNFNVTDGQFAAGMKELPAFARTLRRAGVSRVGKAIAPGHESLTYRKNFELHAGRIRQIAAVLGDEGVRLGLEYVAPKTSWTRYQHPFIHTMAETRELIAEVGKPHVGITLDTMHWYTSGETEADLLSLRNSDIVRVDVNDGSKGVTRERQQDHERELPAATGVIDISTFLNALKKVAYDGPVAAEPIGASVRSLPKEEAIAATSAAMKKAFALIR